MSVIGTFTATKDGGWSGSIRTLMLDVKVRFVPNDNRENENAPLFRIYSGRSEIGAAWRKQSGGEERRDYLSVRLDDPCLGEPILAAMFDVGNGREAQLLWSRRRGDS